MSYAQSMRYIILPQALRQILPPLAGQFISLIKDSSLLGYYRHPRIDQGRPRSGYGNTATIRGIHPA
jgi:hypothetical protein